MSNQIQITGGAKVRSLEGVLTGTSGVLGSVPLGAANGVATLDSGGKVPVSQLPSSVVTYLGTWNAATNTPTLTNGVGDAGDMYICNVAGTVNFGAGPVTFAVGDWVLYGSGTWQKSSGQNGTVTSVAASITGNAIGLTGSPITTAGTLAFAFAGTSGQYVNGAGNLTTFPTLITSIGLSMPSAFSVANSPLTANGSINVTGAGTSAQYIDGTGSLQTFPSIVSQAQNLVTEVYNESGATLTKGTVVYINGGHGNLPTITKALATSDATSAQTYGVVQADITNNNNGYVVAAGRLLDLDTQAYAAGTQLYLSSTTAGAWTSTKQYAPAHLVYVGIVVRSHPTQGVVEVKIQNGYELDELHNVSAQSPSNGNILQYVTSTGLWTAVAGTTTNIAEGTNLYYTDARARGALSFTAGSGAYNSTTGVITIPTNTSQLTNGANFITLASLSAGAGISYNNTTGVITSTITQYTDALARAAISLTTTGTSGAATYNSTTGVLNIPQYTDAYVGTVTSVALSAPTGFSVTGSPVTSSGTLALAFAVGYSLPTTASQSNWDTAYTNRITSATSPLSITSNVISISQATTSTSGYLSSTDWNTFNNKQGTITLTTTGTSGAATFVGNTLNIPQYQAALTNPVTGTGTSNYLPKFTGTSAIGNSSIQDGGSSVTYTYSTNPVFNVSDGTNVTRLGVATTAGAYVNIAKANDGFIRVKNGLAIGTSDGYYGTYFDASGNLGLGVTPSAWFTGSRVLQFGATGALWNNGTNNTALSHNAIFQDASTLYIQTAAASYYRQLDGQHQWFNAPSGTAGNAITFTQAMTLFSDGNLLLTSGTVSNAGYKLDVNGTGRFSDYLQLNSSTYARLDMYGASGYGNQIRFGDGTTLKAAIRQNYNVGEGLEFYTGGTALANLALYINPSGNISIGNTNNTYKLDVNGTGRFSSTLTLSASNFIATANLGTSAAYMSIQNSGGTTYIGRENSAGTNFGATAYSTFIYSGGPYPLEFFTNGTKQLSIASTGAATFSNSVQIGNNSTTPAILTLYPSASAKGWQITANNYVASALEFTPATTNGGTTFSTPAMLITSSGNVGIGTTSPAYQLQLTGTGAATTFRANYFDTPSGTGFNSFQMGVDGSAAGWYVYDNTNGVYRLTIKNNGNVLIGTTTDYGYRTSIVHGGDGLYIRGGSTSGNNALVIGNSSGTTVASINATGAATFSSSVTATSTTATGAAMEIQGSVNAVKTLYINRYGVASGSQHRLRAENAYFEIASANSEPIVLTGGNVGIGTTNPTSKLYVTGDGIFEGTLKTAPTGFGSGAFKIGIVQSGSASSAAGYLPIVVDGTQYYINLYNSTP